MLISHKFKGFMMSLRNLIKDRFIQYGIIIIVRFPWYNQNHRSCSLEWQISRVSFAALLAQSDWKYSRPANLSITKYRLQSIIQFVVRKFRWSEIFTLSEGAYYLVFNTELRDNMSGCHRDTDVSPCIDVSGYCSIVTVIPISDTSHTNHCHDHWYIFIFLIINTKTTIGTILGSYAGIEGLY